MEKKTYISKNKRKYTKMKNAYKNTPMQKQEKVLAKLKELALALKVSTHNSPGI